MKGVDQCVGARNVNQYQYDFIRSFFKVFSNKLKFFVSFASECNVKLHFQALLSPGFFELFCRALGRLHLENQECKKKGYYHK